jgi:acetylornithine deacetylase
MDNRAREAVGLAVDGLRDEMIQTLQALARIPSVTGDEGKAQQFIHKQYQSLGLEVHSLVAERALVASHPAFCNSGRPFEGRPNIIGILKGDPAKKSMVLNGHVDVVSPEPINQWKHDPWAAQIVGTRLYGRGILDMKSGLIANMFALKALMKAGVNPGGTVMLQSVIEEEDGGGGGALACFMEGYIGDGMIVSEPAPFVTVALAGILRCLIRVEGKPAHPSQSHLGISAISKIIPIFQSLEQLDARRKAEVRFPLFEEDGGPACHLIVGTMKGGEWIATVPGSAEMGCRVGFVPGEERGYIKNLVESAIRDAANKDPWLKEHPPIVEWLQFEADPYFQDPNHPFVKSVISSIETLVGKQVEVKPRGGTWSEDTRFAQYFGFPALSLGPSGERPHGVDEYVDLDSVVLTTKAIALATLDWCSREKRL